MKRKKAGVIGILVSLILIVGFEINASIDQVKEEVEEEEMTNDFFTTN